MNEIIRPLAHNLGFDERGQLLVMWEEHGGTYSTIIADMRGKTCPICGKGWELKAEAFRKQFKSSVTDEWCHTACYEGHLGMTEAVMWYNILCHPHDPKLFIPFDWEKIPNEYGGAWNTPWRRVTFLGYIPKLKVGSRKRVYSMSLHDLRPEQVEAFKPLFEKEDVTKEARGAEVLIHAWNESKARDYMEKFVQIIRMDEPKPGSRSAELLEEAKKKKPN